MALTPEDVVNKRFQPTKFREGYDQDEVDDFLDEVVVELRRLNQENEELRQRMVGSETRINDLQRNGAQPVPSETPEPEAIEALPTETSSLPQFGATPTAVPAPVVPAPVAAAPAPVPVPVPVSYPSPEQNAIDTGNTNNLLQLARKLHEEHVREGVEKRDSLIAEGHATAARAVSEAEAAQRAQISALDQEKAALEQQKSAIETRIEGLRTFEREYRQKLKGYIEGQLNDLEAAESSTSGGSSDAAPSEGVYASVSASAAQDESSIDDGLRNDSTGGQTPPAFQGFGGN